jgi:hypothetical protein
VEIKMSPFEYLNQVCGVEEIVVPVRSQKSVANCDDAADVAVGMDRAHHTSAKIVFVSAENRSDYHSTYQTMFEKMVAAMGLDLLQVQLVLTDDEPWPESQTKVRIYLGSAEESVGWIEAQTVRQLVVPSLPEMAQNPEFKKIAWKYLKDLKD